MGLYAAETKVEWVAAWVAEPAARELAQSAGLVEAEAGVERLILGVVS
jgi:hypothetical protein